MKILLEKEHKKLTILFSVIAVIAIILYIHSSFAVFHYEKDTTIVNAIATLPVGKEWDYSFLASEQSFESPLDGDFKLEVWGAGGKGNSGGYATGVYTMNKGDIIYIYTGGTTATYVGGYNGGGNGGKSSYGNGLGGCGATHIATTNRGVLSNYADYQSEVIIVAGGAGGYGDGSSYEVLYRLSSRDGKSGAGGGETGGNAYPAYYYWKDDDYNGINGAKSTALGKVSYVTGGTQTSGYAFGQGQTGKTLTTKQYDTSSDRGRGGGGGGWYGGYASQNNGGAGSDSGGAGGSGHLSEVLTEGSMSNGVNAGAGKVKITLVKYN